MLRQAPKIDSRNAEAIFEEVSARLSRRTDWQRPDATAEALIRVFSRFGEIVIDRLNRVPEKNLIAFLDLLGATPIPPLPARVPLTFVPVEGALRTIRIPEQTQAAAAPEEGETEPVVFETERPLELTTSKLRQVFLLDGAHDTEFSLEGLADRIVSDPAALWTAAHRTAHELALAHSKLFGMSQGARLRLKFDIESGVPAENERTEITWAILAGDKEISLKPVSDTTHSLNKSGEVVFEDLPAWPEQQFRGLQSRWLICRLDNSVRSGEPLERNIMGIEITTEVRLRNVLLEAGANDGQALDLSKDFYPFSALPAFGSTLYIANAAAFSRPGTRVTLNIKLTNPYDASERPPIPTVYVDGHPRVWWEYWNGTAWNQLAVTDSTKSFRVDGVVGFVLPADIARVRINGVENSWIRARLVSGNYGEPEHWDLVVLQEPSAGVTHRPSTLAPPSIKSLTVDYEIELASDYPDAAITYNQRVFRDVTSLAKSRSTFSIFDLPEGKPPALYLGFDATAPGLFVNHSLTLYLHIPERVGRPVSRRTVARTAASLAWQYWTGAGWIDLEIVDQTDGMARSGLVAFVVPDSAATRDNFADIRPCFWLRIVARGDSYDAISRLRGILRNTTLATHAVSVENEVLGSSDGTLDQRFFAARIPILKETDLQLREASLPSEVERVLESVPVEVVEVQRDATGRALEAWVRWNEATDFLGSGPDDRHYTLDRQTGEVRFGDGHHGRIPPRGGNNIRLRRYRTGGGARGNKAAGKVNQLRTAIPYVESVTNLVPALGGFDMESMSAACGRGAKLARHRNRAVTIEDYEDIALLASPEVARARCIPMRDLAADPDATRYCLGTVSLIVVANASGNKPLSTASLLDRVRRFLDDRRDSASELVVVGPEYVQISVEVEFAPMVVEDAGNITGCLTDRVERFLHPLTGGSMQRGWRFGELPQRSDLYGLCASVPGVHHIQSLRMNVVEERTGAIRARNFLVYSGQHRVTVRNPNIRERPPA